MQEKELLMDEILELREKLKEKNEMISNLGKRVSFFQLFIIPLIIAGLTTLIIRQIPISDNQSVGFFIVIFIVSISIATIINKKKIANRKQELINERIAIQKALVKKGKDLSELENNIEK